MSNKIVGLTNSYVKAPIDVFMKFLFLSYFKSKLSSNTPRDICKLAGYKEANNSDKVLETLYKQITKGMRNIRNITIYKTLITKDDKTIEIFRCRINLKYSGFITEEQKAVIKKRLLAEGWQTVQFTESRDIGAYFDTPTVSILIDGLVT